MCKNQYRPDVVSCPGETIIETLKINNMSIDDLALAIGETVLYIECIVCGALPITSGVARALEFLCGVPEHFWINRDRDYCDNLERRGMSRPSIFKPDGPLNKNGKTLIQYECLTGDALI